RSFSCYKRLGGCELLKRPIDSQGTKQALCHACPWSLLGPYGERPRKPAPYHGADGGPMRRRKRKRRAVAALSDPPGGRGEIAAIELARWRDDLQHETQVLDREVREVGKHLRDVGRRHAEPFAERSADLVDRRRRNPGTV